MSTDLPSLTVIIACYNSDGTLADTLDSLQRQTDSDFSVIISDGGSTDNTLSVVERFSNLDLKVSSRPDDGLYDAWNQALSLVTSEYVCFLNSDDFFGQTFVENARRCAINNDADVIIGSTHILDKYGRIARTVNGKVNKLSDLHKGIGFLHPSSLYKTSLFTDFGAFRKHRIAVDSEFLLRLVLSERVRFCTTDIDVFMRPGGLSDKQWLLGQIEYLRALFEYTKPKFTLKVKAYSRACGINVLKLLGVPYGGIKDQIFFCGLAIFNLTVNLTPPSLRAHVFRFLGMSVHPKSHFSGGLRFFHVRNFTMGSGSILGSGCYVDNRVGVYIGTNVNISHGSKIYSLGHDVDSENFQSVGSPVTVEDNAVLFSNVIVMPGVRIREGAVILAGSVVTKDADSWWVYGGNPAKPIRKRNASISGLYNLSPPAYFSP